MEIDFQQVDSSLDSALNVFESTVDNNNGTIEAEQPNNPFRVRSSSSASYDIWVSK